MAEAKSQTRRFLGLLRRTEKASRAHSSQTPTEENAVWALHEKALARTREAGEASQRIATTSAKQRAVADALVDRAHAVVARAQELLGSFARVTDGFERLGLVALNAGLEGARLGEAVGRALLLVSDEVRTHATRGSETARELTSTFGEVNAEITKLHAHIEQARQASGETSHEAARLTAATGAAEDALVEIGNRLRKVTGSDPETLRAVAEAHEHARALVASLSALRGKVPRSLVFGALGPMTEVLAKLLADDDGVAEGERP
jgi:methyl-accepting chemotaxis protein